MPDPWDQYKRAFHYALEGDEFLCKAALRKLDEEDERDGAALQDIALAAGLLQAWAHSVFSETIVPIWSD